jgi:hypothetical protein
MPSAASVLGSAAARTARCRSARSDPGGQSAADNSRSAGAFSGRSVSTRKIVTRPARTCQTCACTSPPSSGSTNVQRLPSGASVGLIGVSDQSRYS